MENAVKRPGKAIFVILAICAWLAVAMKIISVLGVSASYLIYMLSAGHIANLLSALNIQGYMSLVAYILFAIFVTAYGAKGKGRILLPISLITISVSSFIAFMLSLVNVIQNFMNGVSIVSILLTLFIGVGCNLAVFVVSLVAGIVAFTGKSVKVFGIIASAVAILSALSAAAYNFAVVMTFVQLWATEVSSQSIASMTYLLNLSVNSFAIVGNLASMLLFAVLLVFVIVYNPKKEKVESASEQL